MDARTIEIFGFITAPIGLFLFFRFVIWNGVWWAGRKLFGKRHEREPGVQSPPTRHP